MPAQVDRHEVARLRDQGATLVEVLPKEQYAMEHIAGAINIPLKELNAAAVDALPRDRPVVLYCNDQL